uniref:LigA n=1 Tax=Parastrongyloides trichosuri TaxID=131310 RepID=A0A0N4Z3Q3_PARTI
MSRASIRAPAAMSPRPPWVASPTVSRASWASSARPTAGPPRWAKRSPSSRTWRATADEPSQRPPAPFRTAAPRRDLGSRDHRRHRRQPSGRARRPVRRPAGDAGRRPRLHSAGAGERRRRRAGAVRHARGRGAGSGRIGRRAPGLRHRRARLLRRPAAYLRRGDGHQRQDLGRQLLSPDMGGHGPEVGQHGHPGRRRPEGRQDLRPDRPRPDQPRRRRGRPPAGRTGPQGSHAPGAGGLVPRHRPATSGRGGDQGGGLHQSDAGSPRLSRHDGRVPRRQDAPVRGPAAARAHGGSERGFRRLFGLRLGLDHGGAGRDGRGRARARPDPAGAPGDAGGPAPDTRRARPVRRRRLCRGRYGGAGRPAGRERALCSGVGHPERAGGAGRRRARPRPSARRRHRQRRQDQRDPGDQGGPRSGRIKPRLDQELQQPYRRAADAGADAAGHGSGRVRDRHEPSGRDRAAVGLRAPARRLRHHGRAGAYRSLRRRRGGGGAREGRHLRGAGAGRDRRGQRRRRPRRHRSSGRGKGRGGGADFWPCDGLRRAPAGLLGRALGAEQPVRHPDAAGAGRVAGDGFAGAGRFPASGRARADEGCQSPWRDVHPDRRELQRQPAVDEGGLRQSGRQACGAGRPPRRRADRHAGAGRAQPGSSRRAGPRHRRRWSGRGAYSRGADAPAA